MSGFVSRGFQRRRRPPEELADRLPPRQHLERGFPVLTAGPTPGIDTDAWSFRIDGMVGREREWTWDEFQRRPFESVPCDMHDVPGFWEQNGYHNYGDPWQEQRYWTD